MRPNILFVMADQWAAKSLGCYGASLPVSPTLDALAARGTRFARHYANVPVCGPSRACIFTGRSPAAHGVWHNNIEISPDTPLFTTALQNAGYDTWGVGKFHFSPMQEPPPRSFSQLGFSRVEITEDPKHGPYLEWIRREHPAFYETALAMSWPMPYIENRAEWQRVYDRFLHPQKAGFGQIFYPSPLPEELHQTTWITDRAMAQIEAAPRDAPFFGYVSFVDPHDPFDPPAPYATMFDPDDIEVPTPPSWTREGGARLYAEFAEKMFGIRDFSARDWAKLRALFFGSCRFVDDQIARLLAALEARGLHENTVVIFTTDHGEMAGDQGLLMKGPWHFDACVRCPLIVAGRGIEPNAVRNDLSCTYDFAPTILGLCGVEHEFSTPTNRDLLAKNANLAPRNLVLQSKASYVSQNSGAISLVSEENWRLTLFPEENYGELFDLSADPDEQNNLFFDEKGGAWRGELAMRLAQEMAREPYPFPRGQLSNF